MTAPSSANNSVVARPCPWPAPVTIATFPSSRIWSPWLQTFRLHTEQLESAAPRERAGIDQIDGSVDERSSLAGEEAHEVADVLRLPDTRNKVGARVGLHERLLADLLDVLHRRLRTDHARGVAVDTDPVGRQLERQVLGQLGDRALRG